MFRATLRVEQATCCPDLPTVEPQNCSGPWQSMIRVVAAGAGPGSGAERRLTMDRDGAIKLLPAASIVRAQRYLIVSSVGGEQPLGGNDVFSVYLRAKAEADQAVAASDRDSTIVRPGRLTDTRGTGRARIDTDPFRGDVARDDVAAVLVHLLHDPRQRGQNVKRWPSHG